MLAWLDYSTAASVLECSTSHQFILTYMIQGRLQLFGYGVTIGVQCMPCAHAPCRLTVLNTMLNTIVSKAWHGHRPCMLSWRCVYHLRLICLAEPAVFVRGCIRFNAGESMDAKGGMCHKFRWFAAGCVGLYGTCVAVISRWQQSHARCWGSSLRCCGLVRLYKRCLVRLCKRGLILLWRCSCQGGSVS